MKDNIAIIGGGSWGTSLWLLLNNKGYTPKVWEYSEENIKIIKKYRENKRYLPGVILPQSFYISSSLEDVLYNTQVIILAIPSQKLRELLSRAKKYIDKNSIIVSGIKGIELNTFKRMSEVIEEEVLVSGVCVISGPSHAEEVSRGLPTAVVAASKNKEIARFTQNLFFSEKFRVYTVDDIVGVEIAGALKNIIAIAAGIVDGLSLGDNTKAALITRGVAEISRFGLMEGAKIETFWGLAGIGDVIVTCTSRYSRNRKLGELLAKGFRLEEAQKHIGMTTEGVATTSAVVDKIRLKNISISMPITDQVYSILFEGKNIDAAIRELMLREPKDEW